MKEDKVMLCRMFLGVLQATDRFNNLLNLEYSRLSNCDEIVTAVFKGGFTYHVNVSMDSGAAMLEDILRQLGY